MEHAILKVEETHMAAYYHCFAMMKSEQKGGKQIAEVRRRIEYMSMKITYYNQLFSFNGAKDI